MYHRRSRQCGIRWNVVETSFGLFTKNRASKLRLVSFCSTHLFYFFFSPSLSIVLILLRYRLACPKLLIPRENSRHRQVETDRRETSKCPRTQRRRAIISLTLDSPVRLVSANLIIRDQVRRIPLHTYAYSTARRGEAHGRRRERERERGRERERPGFPWSYRYKGPRTYVGTLYL